jgi:hypothetical protein
MLNVNALSSLDACFFPHTAALFFVGVADSLALDLQFPVELDCGFSLVLPLTILFAAPAGFSVSKATVLFVVDFVGPPESVAVLCW